MKYNIVIAVCIAVISIILVSCTGTSASDADTGTQPDPFDRPLPEYFSNYVCDYISPEGTIEYTAYKGLQYWVERDVNGNLIAQLVGIGTVSENQVITVPEYIYCMGERCKVISVGLCFQPFKVRDYSSTQYMGHVGLCDNYQSSGPNVTYNMVEPAEMNDPVHYSIVFEGCVKVQDYAFCEFEMFCSPHLSAYCFHMMSGLTSVEFKKGCTSIGDWAFSYTCLSEITIPKDVVTVGKYAFYESDVNSVIWETDADIQDNTFDHSRIKNITINGEPKSIGDWAFFTSDLRNISIPDSVLELGEHAFHLCNKLTTVSIGHGISVIPVACFLACDELTQVNVSGNIIEVQDGAFYNGPHISQFDFTGIEKIGSSAFEGAFNGNMTIVLDLSKVKRIEDRAFAGCSCPFELILSSELEYVGKYALCVSGEPVNAGIEIPDGCVVSDGAFWGIKITSLTFGDGCIVKTKAFANCKQLETLNICENCIFEDAVGVNGPEGIFAGSALKSVTIPNSVVLGRAAFMGCEQLTDVIFEDGRERIPQECFQGCTGLASVRFPSGLKTIELYAFKDCIHLDISQTMFDCTVKDVLSWSSQAFTGSASIEICDLFEGDLEGSISFLRLTLVINGIPEVCSFMADIIGVENSMQLEEPYSYAYVFPEDLAGIYDEIMGKKMPKFECPNGLYRIFDGAMYDETGFVLIKVPYNQLGLNIPDNVCIIAPKACAGTYLTTIHIPSSVIEIGESAFQGCSNLAKVTFEEGLERIGTGAFAFTSINKVTLPSSLEYLGDAAFNSYSSLGGAEITIPCDSNLTYIGSRSLVVVSGGSIYVPKGLTDVGELSFGYEMSTIYLGAVPSVYGVDFLRSSTSEVLINGQWVQPHPYNVAFYLPLGTDISGIVFDQLLGCEGGYFAGYYVPTANGPLVVDDVINTPIGTVYLYSPLGKITELSQSTDDDGIMLTLRLGEHWTKHDIVCEIDTGEAILSESDSPYVVKILVRGDFDGAVITITERAVSESVTVTFDSQGGSNCSVVTVGAGRTLADDFPIPTKNRSVFAGWFDSNGTEIKSYSPISSNITLEAKWADANPRIIFDVYSHMMVKVNGQDVVSGCRVSPEDMVTISWIANEGFVFDHWIVSTPFASNEFAEEQYTFSGIADDTTIAVAEGYYVLSDSLRYINSVDFPLDSSSLYLQWMTSFVQNTNGMQWTGGTGTPLVVNGHLYTRAGDTLYMYDLDTGRIVKTVQSKEATSFYHYLGYANGFIMDYMTKKAYDLNLNEVCDLPINPTKTLWDETGIYLVGGAGGIFKYSLDLKELIWRFSEGYCNYSSWGVTGGIQIYDGYLYWVGLKGGVIVLQSVDLTTGKDFHELVLPKFKNFMLDDGWITCYDNTIYLTVYSTGLFGDNNGATGGGVIATAINKGEFSEEYAYYDLGNLAHSNFIVYNGRGYVNSGYSLYVFDVDGKNLSEAYHYRHNYYTHGGIVVNVPPGSDTVEVMFIPYDPTMSIIVFYDKPGQSLPQFRSIKVEVPSQYNSQGIRFTDDGRIYFYNDAGNVCILGEKIDYTFLILRENDTIRCIRYAGSIEEALSELNISDTYYKYMLKSYSGDLQLDYDESIAEHYRNFFISDVSLDVAVWDKSMRWYSDEYGIKTIDEIKMGHLYLDGAEFLLIDKGEYSYSIRFVDSSGNELKTTITGKASAGTELNVSNYVDKVLNGYVYKGVSTERFAISPDESRNVLTFTYDLPKPTVIDMTDKISEGAATLSVAELQTLVDDGNPVELVLPQGTIELDAGILNSLSDKGAPISIRLDTVEIKDLSEGQRVNVPDGALVFSISIESMGEHIHELGGTAKIALPISVSGNDLALWYLDDSGTMHRIGDAVFSEGIVSFTTDHLSYYVVGQVPSTNESGFQIMYVAAIVSAIVLALGIAIYLRRRPHA